MIKGIPFSTPLVLALLADEKRQTRRIIKGLGDDIDNVGDCESVIDMATGKTVKMPWSIGDRLYVKETVERANGEAVGYRADGSWLPNTPWRWKVRVLSSRYMPRELSRIWLDVTDVRLERLQDITEADAIAEGSFLNRCSCPQMQAKPKTPIDALFRQTGCAIHGTEWRTLWDGLHDKPGERWADNPWIVALTFTVNKGNIDE